MNAIRRKRRSALPDPYRIENLPLSDGRTMQIRPIAHADGPLIAASFELLHEEEVRRRFLHPIKALGEEHMHRLTHPDPDSDFVVVAAEPLAPGDALIGAVARLARDADAPERAEFGILVSHFVSGLGLGGVLMQRLFDWCRANQVLELWGDVMDDNTPMLALAQSLGFHREVVTGSPGLVHICKSFKGRQRVSRPRSA